MSRPRAALVAGFAAALLAGGCIARGPVRGAGFDGLALEAKGNQIRLGWTADSPVVRLLRPGVMVAVVASYEADGGRVTGEPVSAPLAVRAGSSELLFTLVDGTRHPPAGPVCLRLRAGPQSLPLRYADEAAADRFARPPTDGFQYAAWRDRALATVRLLEAERQRARLQSALASARAAEAGSEARLAGYRASGPGCSVPAATSAGRAPSRNVIEPGRWSGEAELECTARFARLAGGSGPAAVEFAGLIERRLADVEGGMAVAARRLQAVVVRQVPALPGFQSRLPRDHELGITAETRLALQRMNRGGSGDDLTGTFLGVTAAFDSCLPEVRGQFELAWNAWQAAQASNIEAELDTARQQARRLECEAAEADAKQAIEQRRTLESRLAAVEADRAAADRLRPASTATTPLDLLDQRCEPEPAAAAPPPAGPGLRRRN